MIVDFTLLDPPPHLWLSFDTSFDANVQLRWLILDHNADDKLYTRAATLDHAIAFVRAAVKNGDVTADETSIEFHRMWRATMGGHSMRVPGSGAGGTDGGLSPAPDSPRLRLVL